MNATGLKVLSPAPVSRAPFGVSRGAAACVAALTLTLAACDPIGSEGKSDARAKVSMDPALPDTLYYGSKYTTIAKFENCASPCAWKVFLSDSVVYGYEGGSPAYSPLEVRALRPLDTLRLIASVSGRSDTTMLKVLHARVLGGFAPIEASGVRVYHEQTGSAVCYGGGTSRFETTLTPLGPSLQGFRFERMARSLSGTDSGKVTSKDTLLLRREHGLVQLWRDTGWTTPGITGFPYLAQDTISAGLDANAKPGAGTSATITVPLSNNSWVQAVYREGAGLVEYQATYGMSVCGPSYVHSIRLQ